MKGAVRILVSTDLIVKVLHMPDDCEIVDVHIVNVITPTIEFTIKGDDLPSCDYGKEPKFAFPIVSYEPEKYTWDWNLPVEIDNNAQTDGEDHHD